MTKLDWIKNQPDLQVVQVFNHKLAKEHGVCCSWQMVVNNQHNMNYELLHNFRKLTRCPISLGSLSWLEGRWTTHPAFLLCGWAYGAEATLPLRIQQPIGGPDPDFRQRIQGEHKRRPRRRSWVDLVSPHGFQRWLGLADRRNYVCSFRHLHGAQQN